jgi:hypothetical protein
MLSSTGSFTNNGTLDLTLDPNFVFPSNFINNGAILGGNTSSPTDTPTLPPWAFAAFALLLLLVSSALMPTLSPDPRKIPPASQE